MLNKNSLGDLDLPEDKPEEKADDKQEDRQDDKQDDRLPCPDCGRLLSKKTLRYTHKYQCPNKPQTLKQAPNTREPTASTKEPTASTSTKEPAPSKPTLMQSRRAPIQRYEHIKLF